jgi:hypothetical protein
MPLQERILEAYADGDLALVKQLQAEFRASGVVVCAKDRGYVGTARVVEKTPPARTSATTTSPSRTRPRNPQEGRHAGAATLLRDAVPIFRVDLGERRPEIEREIHDAYHRLGGRRRETGGWLYSARPHDERGVILAFASGPGLGSRHEEASVDLGAPATFADFLGRAVHLCGCWHLHDVPGVTWPGERDLDGFVEELREHRFSSWISIIATPTEDGSWMFPRLSAWRTYRNRAGEFICEPAVLEGD